MDPAQLRTLLEEVRDRAVGVEDGLARLAAWPALDLGHSRVDTQRELRCGFPEVVYGAGKSPDELAEIAAALVAQHGRLLVTRARPEGAQRLAALFPEAVCWPRSGAVTVGLPAEGALIGDVLIVAAGTAGVRCRWYSVPGSPSTMRSSLHDSRMPRTVACE